MSALELLRPMDSPAFVSFALFVLRCTAGFAFVLHGADKIRDPFDWMGPQSAMPAALQALAAASEFFGGLAWIAGCITPVASLGILCTMAVAVARHALVRGDPFVSQEGASFELAAIYGCVALLLLVAGPGRLSLDRLVFGLR